MDGARFLATLLSLALPYAAMADAAAIGTLSAYGEVRLGSAEAPSGATVFDGQRVTTGAGGEAVIALGDTTRIALGRATQARLSTEGIVLERGSARFETAPKQAPIFAAGLRLEPEAGTSSVEASLRSRGRVNVAVLSGGIRVLDPSGAALASVRAGQALLFGLAGQEQQGQEKGQGRSGGQAPGGPGAKPAGGKSGGSHTALYVVIGAGAAAAGVGIALSQKRGS